MQTAQKPQFAVIPPEQTGGVPVKIWATAPDPETGKPYANVEAETILQASRAARLPFAFKHVALMPDAHVGMGLPIGGVFAADKAIVPYFVGNDIGCGMCVLDTGVPADDIDVESLMKQWEKNIPVGQERRSNSDVWLSKGPFKKVFKKLDEDVKEYEKEFKHYKFDLGTARIQMGTLGDGNHFVELQKDENGIAHIMIHSGSRALGNSVFKCFHAMAVRLCTSWHVKLESPTCAYFPMPSEEGNAYARAMQIAVQYALSNRAMMMQCAVTALKKQVSNPKPVEQMLNIAHNYAAIEHHYGRNVWVHRKGATLAREKTIGIIPGSMCSKSYIVQGKNNDMSFHSCSHGAGRNFSRTEAVRRVMDGEAETQDQQLTKAGVRVFGAERVEDELGHAYKDVSVVMQNQQDLIEIKKGIDADCCFEGLKMSDKKLHESIEKAAKESGGHVSSAKMGEKKRFYCPRCDTFEEITIGMRVPRHDCGRQMRTAWQKDFKREPDKK